MAGRRRQSKWKRTRKPDRLILQPRDMDIICAVYEYRYLSRDQIQRLVSFNCVTKANIRLRKLYDSHYLSRLFLPTTRGSSKAIYFLSKKGVDIVTEILGIDPLIVKKEQKQSSQVKSLFLNHHLNLNEVRIAFSKAIQEHPDMKLERWIDDHHCLQEYDRYCSGQKVKRFFRPDGYFRFWYKERLYSYFVELDQATMSHQRFKIKVKEYEEFARSGRYQKIFGVSYFRVLVIVPSVQRMLNLKKTIEALTNKIFWVTTLKKITSDDSFGPIWFRAGHDGLHPLMEIGS
jgi:hypothetical protein